MVLKSNTELQHCNYTYTADDLSCNMAIKGEYDKSRYWYIIVTSFQMMSKNMFS